MSKLLKECTFKFLGSDKAVTKPGGVEEHRKPLRNKTVSMSRDVNYLLTVTYQSAGVPKLPLGLSSMVCSMQLNRLFLNSGVREIVEV